MPEIIARQLAIETRLKIGLQSTEYFDIYRSLGILKISCIKRPLESNISGATCKTDRVKLILVNSSKTLGHQNFTIAHEIYHCLYDDNLLNRTCKAEIFDKTRSNEQVAEYFAAHLLMPEDAILQQLRLRNKLNGKLNLADIINLEQFFSVSRRAMCWRLESLKLISRSESEKYQTNVIRGARELGKDIALYQPTRDSVLISDYAEKAREAMDKNLITESRYQEILADAGLLEEMSGYPEATDSVD